ncbi:DUF2162 domain-containing protein [Sinanaerobacter sp. ZZT-01]|uniref:DUF2162 domain-containing protein n=1 Tax=Sinanaerobacter sp. ZZT-01 TaxID=3111540 RepID=UPI002D77F282|nr:DUF2162 domain-containing protein [Sinanaerobacter sp. ZZT-01]WRR95090.1 DUF2162 domain-containing protein [Sinanaerobacter sp. ZZT-01]
MSVFGLFIATLILSLKSGLILGMSQRSAKQMVLISLSFAICLGILVLLFEPMQGMMVDILDKYTFAGSVLMALFLIYLGINGEECSACSERSTYKNNIIVLLPCPLCLIALALTVILLGPPLKLPPAWLGWATAAIFFILLLLVSFGIRRLMKTISIDAESILNTFLLILGTFTLCCGLFIPSLVQSMATQFSPITLESGRWTLSAVAGMVALLIAGYVKHTFIEKEGERNK